MNRPQPSSSAQRPQPTLRVLGRLPYVAPSSEDSAGVSESEPSLNHTPLALSEPVRRGLIYGVATLLILGGLWYIVSRKTDNTELASKSPDKSWEVQMPRPDAPEAPAWSPHNSGEMQAQSAQAQESSVPVGSFAGPQTPAKSPLGFDLPPGNSWGQPTATENAFAQPAETAGVPYSPQTANAGAPYSAFEAQTAFNGWNGGASNGFANPQSMSAFPQGVVTTPPWVNAAGQPSAGQPGGFTAERLPLNQGETALQPTSPSGPVVMRNPYVVSGNTPGATLPSGLDQAGYTATSTPTGMATGPYGTPSLGPAAPTPNAWSASGYPTMPYEAVASRPRNDWQTPAVSNVQQPTSGYPANTQPAMSGWNQAGYGVTSLVPAAAIQDASASSAGYPSATYPQSDGSMSTTQQLPGWKPSPPVPSFPSWNVPPSHATPSPSYPGSTNPYPPANRPNPQPDWGQDPGVVPATYANSVNADSRLPQWSYPSTQNPSATSVPNTNTTSPQYPSTGQTGYGLYPSTTLR